MKGVQQVTTPRELTEAEARAANVALAVVALKRARDLFVAAGATHAAEATRRALKSGDGAARNADRWAREAARGHESAGGKEGA